MTTAAEVLEIAKALPREERAELAEELLATLGDHNLPEGTRLAAVCAAVDKGVADLDAGNGIEMTPDGVRDYLRERGRQATARAAAQAM